LFFSVFSNHFRPVSSLQCAEVPLVKTPTKIDWDGHLIQLVQNGPKRANGSFEDRSKREIKVESCLAQLSACSHRIAPALWREINVGPSSQAIF
jgi:hypothetical protein